MNGPVIGGVGVLAVAITVGAVAMVRSTPEPRHVSAPSHHDRGVKTAPDPANSIPKPAPTRVQPNLPQKAPQGSPPVRRATPEQLKRPTLQSHEQRPATPPPVAMRPAPTDPRQPASRSPPRADQLNDTLNTLTPAEISRIKTSLRLTQQQHRQWRQVEAVLRDIGRNQSALVSAGRKPEVEVADALRLMSAAQPLLQTLRPDQKDEIRRLARKMGYEAAAARI
jgi:hypothetical protein